MGHFMPSLLLKFFDLSLRLKVSIKKVPFGPHSTKCLEALSLKFGVRQTI